MNLNKLLFFSLILYLSFSVVHGQEHTQDTPLLPDEYLCPFDTVEVKCGKETFQIEISRFCDEKCAERINGSTMFQKFRVLHKGKEVFWKFNINSWDLVENNVGCRLYAEQNGIEFASSYFWLFPTHKSACTLMCFGYSYPSEPESLSIYRLDETGRVECLYDEKRCVWKIRKEGRSIVMELVSDRSSRGFLFDSSPYASNMKYWELQIKDGIPRERMLTDSDRTERLKDLERQCRKLFQEPIRELIPMASYTLQGVWKKGSNAGLGKQMLIQSTPRGLLKVGVRCGDKPLCPDKEVDRWLVIVGDSLGLSDPPYFFYRFYDPSGKSREARFSPGNYFSENEDGFFTATSPYGEKYTITTVIPPLWYKQEQPVYEAPLR